MTDPTSATETSTGTGPDADVIAGLWLAEDHQAQTLAEVRAQLDAEAKTDWLDDARAKERTRQRLEALRQQRRAQQPPPPQAPVADPQQLRVHHTFDPQPPAPPTTGARLFLAGRLIGFLVPIAIIVGAFLILIGSALVLDSPTTPEQRARSTVAEHQWTCDDAADVAALTVDDDNVLWHWITPIGHCDELAP